MKVKSCAAYTSLFLSASLLLITTLAYILKFDSMMAVTFFPAWLWLIPGLAFAFLALLHKRRPALIMICCWLLFLILMVEEVHTIGRGLFINEQKIESLRQQGKALRVIALNCAGANADAAKEAISYKPDILMLTESPSKADAGKLAKELFGTQAAMAWDHEATIIARGTVISRSLDKHSAAFMTMARITLQNGCQIETISARLLPAYIGLNLFSPYNWKLHRENRIEHHKQISKVLEQIKLVPESMPIIFGGDLNVVAADGSLNPLKPRLRDCVRSAGVGWPNTAPNEIPLVRIDQIWTSLHFKVLSARAVKTQNSDHRMLICDLQLK